jgi:hypothetical protein
VSAYQALGCVFIAPAALGLRFADPLEFTLTTLFVDPSFLFVGHGPS